MKKITAFFILFFLLFIGADSFCETDIQKINISSNINVKLEYPVHISFSFDEIIHIGFNKNQQFFETMFQLFASNRCISAKTGFKISPVQFSYLFFELNPGFFWDIGDTVFDISTQSKEKKELRYFKYVDGNTFIKYFIIYSYGAYFHFNIADVISQYKISSWTNLIFSILTYNEHCHYLKTRENQMIYYAIYSIEYKMPLPLNRLKLEFSTKKINPFKKIYDNYMDFELSGSMFFIPLYFMTLKLEAVWNSNTDFLFSNTGKNTQSIYGNTKFNFQKISVSFIFTL